MYTPARRNVDQSVRSAQLGPAVVAADMLGPVAVIAMAATDEVTAATAIAFEDPRGICTCAVVAAVVDVALVATTEAKEFEDPAVPLVADAVVAPAVDITGKVCTTLPIPLARPSRKINVVPGRR